jgi:hypothetical protein
MSEVREQMTRRWRGVGGSIRESSRCVESNGVVDGIRRKLSCVGLCACKLCAVK